MIRRKKKVKFSIKFLCVKQCTFIYVSRGWVLAFIPVLLRESFPEKHGAGGPIWYNKSTSHTLTRTHVPGMFISLEGRRSLVQCPVTPPYFVPAQWMDGGARGTVNAIKAPALNCNSSLKGKGTVCEHVSPLLP